MESPFTFNSTPFYLEYSGDHKKYNFHLSFESAAAAQSASKFLQNDLGLPITLAGNHVVILAKSEGGEFGVDTGSTGRYGSEWYADIIGVRSANNQLFHLILKSNLCSQLQFYCIDDWTHCDRSVFKQFIPSRHRQQSLMRQPHYDASIFKKFRLFQFLPNIINLPKELLSYLFKTFFLGYQKNPVYVPSLEPIIIRFLLNQQTPPVISNDSPEEEKLPVFDVTCSLELENSQNPSLNGGAKLHLYPAGGELTDFLQKNFSTEIRKIQNEYTQITILPAELRIPMHGIMVAPTNLQSSSNNPICSIHFKNKEMAYEFTQRVCLKNKEGEMLAYRLTDAMLTLLPKVTFYPEIMYGISNDQKTLLPDSEAKLPVEPTSSLKDTALGTAIEKLNEIFCEENHNVEIENIYQATCQLLQALTQHIDEETRLAAIRDYERACGIDLGTKIGQAVAMVIVAAIGFTLGVVIGEAIGIPSGAWTDVVSATLKIIETFSGTITAGALAVLGGATLGGIAASTVTYCAFFKPSVEKLAAEKVASEAKLMYDLGT